MKDGWLIKNSADYATILARGRRFVSNKWQGSLDWSNGLSPMLAKSNKDMQRKLDAIKE